MGAGGECVPQTPVFGDNLGPRPTKKVRLEARLAGARLFIQVNLRPRQYMYL